MENVRRNKFENYEDVNNLITNHADAKSQLSIQRCYSDGVLTHGQVSAEGKVLSASYKSSSESSMNGSPASTPTKLDVQKRMVTGVKCGTSSSQSSDDSYNDGILNGRRQSSDDNADFNLSVPIGSVVRPKTWKCRITERKLDEEQSRGRNGDLELQLNGLDIANGIRVHQRGYSQNVCDLYKNETDLFLSRLRGGTRKDTDTNGIPACLKNGFDGIRHQNHENRSARSSESSSESNGIVCNGSACNEIKSDIQCLIAPLAIPENLSDEESPMTESSHKETLECVAFGNDADSSVSENDPSFSVGCSTVTMPNCLQGVSRLLARSSNPSHREHNKNIREGDLNGAECLECNPLDPDMDLDIKLDNSRVQERSEEIPVENEGAQESFQPVRASSVSSFDSIDDIGDFIEADLPPNVERLAFFSRGSSSPSSIEEDEGCGDEVLPSNLDGEESENETIDPLTSNSCSRYPFQNGQNKLQNDNDVIWKTDCSESHNGLSLASNNLFCEEEEDSYLCNGCACGGVGTHDKGQTNRLDSDTSHHWNSFVNEDKYGGKSCNKVDNTCVCCDKVIDVNFQRKEEIGVNVCDKCFNEHNFDKNGTFENATRKRSKPIGAFSLNAQFHQRNCNSLHVVKNMQEKVNNNNFIACRLSSSDSEPLDKLYLSDSSEVVSPEAEVGGELVFHPNGVNIVEGATGNMAGSTVSAEEANITDECTDGADGVNIISQANVQCERVSSTNLTLSLLGKNVLSETTFLLRINL